MATARPSSWQLRWRSQGVRSRNATRHHNFRSEENAMTAIGMVGIGDMGSEMLPHLIAGGYPVWAFDPDPSRLRAAVAAGATAAESPADAARHSDVVLSLVMSDDIPTAHFGENGILQGLRPGALLVICSTTTPAVLDEVRRMADPAALVLDAPIVGGVRYAREKAVTFLVGGDPQVVTQAEDVLASLGKVERVGAAGSGVIYKLITNAFVMAAEVGLREALDLTDILGGDYETALRLFGIGPMAAVVKRALDESNPRPLRASAEDFDTLLSAVDNPALLRISSAGRDRIWAAVDAEPGHEPMFVELTRKSTAFDSFRSR
ncbi:NAD(P)-dependent oxidoreductase [Mycolicibacterium hodleri]|uniref:NAD(P)-dependent oxidoreductase n=1 Tax=Mycolicibacterium hodleri TaxID=49897 RepID=A0A502EE13_9MYCO|nr:NAD(P)-binding domain-containing protein [Mycolicibacterium hodleri]TPG35943.1 NAD(P)-dependent oxidoreductase [Mycolicibacterium hodleri]